MVTEIQALEKTKNLADSTSVTSKPVEQSDFINSIIDVGGYSKQKFSLNPDYYVYSEVQTKEDVAKATGFSQEFVDKLIYFEGCKLYPYKDKTDNTTIGFGHNIDADKTYDFADKNQITEPESYQLLAKDLLRVKKEVDICVGDAKLNQNQKEALSELIFNVGMTKVLKKKDSDEETDLIKYIKKGDFDKASCEFNFITIDGEVHHQQCKRRFYDMVKFNSGQFSQESFNALKSIYTKGVESLDRKIEYASFLSTCYFRFQKFLYTGSQKPILESIEENINK